MSTLAKFSFNHTRELVDLSPKGIKSEISKLKCQHIVLSFVTKINSASYIWTLYGMRNFFEIPTTQNTHTLLTRGGATRNFLERQNWTKRHECKVVETSVLKRYQKRATQNSRQKRGNPSPTLDIPRGKTRIFPDLRLGGKCFSLYNKQAQELILKSNIQYLSYTPKWGPFIGVVTHLEGSQRVEPKILDRQGNFVRLEFRSIFTILHLTRDRVI